MFSGCNASILRGNYMMHIGPCKSRTSLPFLLCFSQFLLLCCASLITFKSTWEILGPFQIGTREATWGADPLEYVGGFKNLSYDSEAVFRSSLPTNGIAKWNVTEAVQTASDSGSANASLSVSYSNVDWDSLKVIYGWSAVQYQAWARGELIIRGNETRHLVLHTDAILEFWIDGAHYFGGDYYSFRRAPPVLHLTPGSHKLDVRLVRDVRAFGGILEPSIDVAIGVQQVSGLLELSRPGILLSDVVEGKIASSIASVSLRNSGERDIEIVDIQPSNTGHPILFAKMDSDLQAIVEAEADALTTTLDGNASFSGIKNPQMVIVAGQTRPVVFNISLPSREASSVKYTITYRIDNTHNYTLDVSQDLHHLSIYEPHKVTFLHPGIIVSYAMLRPPAKNATCYQHQQNMSVLLVLHGAGLEADNPLVTGALDPVGDLCAWVLFPTGSTPWSGDDWHNWGFSDVEAAIEAILVWIQNVGWEGPGVNIDRWIVSGHSNGGQGTWYAITHRPDKVLAAAPVSGYASIQKYVSYELWQPADPRRTAVISASLNSYRHEMLMANARGIPIQQQHGQIDNNVPAYHSRFLAQQLFLAGANSSYNEVEGQNHWWDTVMTTPRLIDFYHEQCNTNDVLPRKLDEFSIIVADPGDMGSKSGIHVTHLQDPGQYGRVDVKGRTIRTSNVRRLQFDPVLWKDSVIMDGQTLILEAAAVKTRLIINVFRVNNAWTIGSSKIVTSQPQRQGRQLGSMTAILRSRGPFIIQHSASTNTSHLALQISRNLHQYFQADTIIISSNSYLAPAHTTSNVITLAVGSSLKAQDSFPIHVSEAGATIRHNQGQVQQYGEDARGAAFLRPLDGERLELVLWGLDTEGLQQAARVVPMLTGVGQPDFVVLGESTKWRGIEGALAMGFFDSNWEVTASSFVETR